MNDLANDPDLAAGLCREAHVRLLRGIDQLSDARARTPSRLRGWTVGHVLTHLARNADAHARRLTGALWGRDMPKYPDGERQRRSEIESGAFRSARDLCDDVEQSQVRLEQVMERCAAAVWPNSSFLGDGSYPVTACPAHRLREIELHHVDLGLGYEPSEWSAQYVEWDLPNLLSTVPQRSTSLRQRQAMLAWLTGRAAADSYILDPW